MAADDAELARLAAEVHGRGDHLTASVRSGDVLRTLGIEHPRDGDDSVAYPMDLGFVELVATGAGGRSGGVGSGAENNGLVMPFVAHVLAGGAGWAPTGAWIRGARNDPRRLTCVMNAAWAGPFRLGPRAHLNDGRLDLTDGRLAFGELREARRRARSGSHLPHPGLTVRRVDHLRLDFDRPRLVWVDGHPIGPAGGIEVRLHPDALTVVA